MSEDKNMISDEAVEAAAKALWDGSDLARAHNAWEFLEEAVNIRPAFRNLARRALEAAAPHMLAEASAIIDQILELHVPVMKGGEPAGCSMCDWEHPIFTLRTKWPCPTVFAITGPNRANPYRSQP